jgi:hypothetical protein
MRWLAKIEPHLVQVSGTFLAKLLRDRVFMARATMSKSILMEHYCCSTKVPLS